MNAAATEPCSPRSRPSWPATGATPTKFGIAAVNDGHLVANLRKGHSVTLKTADKVRAFIGQALAAIPSRPCAVALRNQVRPAATHRARHRRRHRRLQVPRADPPPARARRSRVHAVLTRAAQQFVTPLSVGALSQRARVHRPVRPRRRARDRPHPPLARGGSDRGGARHRRPHRQDGRRACRRPCLLACCSPPTSRCWWRLP